MNLELFLGILTMVSMLAILFWIITQQAEKIRGLTSENLRLHFHRRQMANALQTCADRLEVFIESDLADEDDQEAYNAALHLASLARKIEQEEVTK